MIPFLLPYTLSSQHHNNLFLTFITPSRKFLHTIASNAERAWKFKLLIAINIEWQQQWLNSTLIVPYPFHSWCIWVFQCVQWQVDSLAQSVSKSYYIKRWHQSMSQSSYSNTIIKQSYYSSKKWWGTKLNRCLLLLWMDIKLNTKHFILRQIKKK